MNNVINKYKFKEYTHSADFGHCTHKIFVSNATSLLEMGMVGC